MLAETISQNLDVSVSILSYKRPLFLADAIKSVLAQTKRPKEITIFDNGSDNNVKLAVDEFFQYGVSWEGAETTQSVHWNFNRAAKKANSKYVLIMHDDDKLCSDFLEKQINFLEKNRDIIAVGCNGYIINSEGCKNGALILPNEDGNKVYNSSVKVALKYASHSCLLFASFVYRTDCIKNIQIKDRFNKVADVVLLCDLADIGPIAYQDLPLYEVRVHSGQDSVNIPEYQTTLLNDFFMTLTCDNSQLVKRLQMSIRKNITIQAIVNWWGYIRTDKSSMAVLKISTVLSTNHLSIIEAIKFILCGMKNILTRKVLKI